MAAAQYAIGEQRLHFYVCTERCFERSCLQRLGDRAPCIDNSIASGSSAGQAGRRTMKGCTSPRVPVHMSRMASRGTSGREERGSTIVVPVLPWWARACNCLAALCSLRLCLRLSDTRSLRSEGDSALGASPALPSWANLRNRPPSAVTPCQAQACPPCRALQGPWGLAARCRNKACHAGCLREKGPSGTW